MQPDWRESVKLVMKKRDLLSFWLVPSVFFLLKEEVEIWIHRNNLFIGHGFSY